MYECDTLGVAHTKPGEVYMCTIDLSHNTIHTFLEIFSGSIKYLWVKHSLDIISSFYTYNYEFLSSDDSYCEIIEHEPSI